MRRMLYTLGIVLTVLMAVGPTLAEEQPDGMVKIQSGSLAAGIGWSWGSGTIVYQGKENHFKVDGLTVGTVGFVMSDTNGEVYNTWQQAEASGPAVGRWWAWPSCRPCCVTRVIQF